MYPLETLLLIAILATNIVYLLLHAPLVYFFLRLRVFLLNFLSGFTNAENRKGLWLEVGHGVGRALMERMGSAKGVIARQGQAAGIESLIEGGGNALGALGAIRGKIDLPIVGKVSPIEAFQLFQSLRGLMAGGGLGQIVGSNPTGAGAAGSGAAQLP